MPGKALNKANLSKKARTSTIDRDGRERTERTQTKGTITNDLGTACANERNNVEIYS